MIAICIVLCTLIVCSFTFFTIVYLSELKREKELRKQIQEQRSKDMNIFDGNPIILVGSALDAKPTKSNLDLPEINNKDKKIIN